MELRLKDFITVTVNMHNMFKDLKENKNIERKEMKAIKENQMEFTGLKNIFEIKTHWLGIKITDNAEKTSVDLKYKEKNEKKKKITYFVVIHTKMFIGEILWYRDLLESWETGSRVV